MLAGSRQPIFLGVVRSLARRTLPRYSSSQVAQDLEDDDIELKLEDHGEYDMIIPQDPQRVPTRSVPGHIPRPHYADSSRPKKALSLLNSFVASSPGCRIELGGKEEQKLRGAAHLARRTLAMAGGLIMPGVTTDDIDARVHEFILSHGAYPSPLLYKGFPKSCCTSVNNVMVHGIPDSRPLREGDIVNVDITVYFEGYHGDTSRTFLVGEVDELGKELVEVTEQALEAGIQACAPGRPYRDIGKAIFRAVKGKDFSISSAFTGHGIGKTFHCPPWIIHTPNEEPGIMLPGDCFTIEPCIVRGSNADHMMFPDDWTVSSTNWARSAQTEHMVLVTENGVDVLTRPDI